MNLRQIFSALELEPSASQLESLLKYLDLLERWNATYNLTAVRDRTQMLTQHLADCAAVVRPLQRHAGNSCRVLDVGSGGGLPAVVIATLLPACDVSCVDSVAKKVAFVRQVAGVLQLPNLQAWHSRVEDLRTAPYEVITARAFGSLGDLTRLTRSLLTTKGAWMAMKGKVPRGEIEALPANVTVFHVEQLSIPGLDAERCLVWMRPTALP